MSRISELVFGKMIPQFLKGQIKAVPQEGEPVVFKRRTPEQSVIPEGLSPRQLYDYIRMLDGEGYPAAYKEAGDIKIYFKNARLQGEKVSAEAILDRG